MITIIILKLSILKKYKKLIVKKHFYKCINKGNHEVFRYVHGAFAVIAARKKAKQ